MNYSDTDLFISDYLFLSVNWLPVFDIERDYELERKIHDLGMLDFFRFFTRISKSSL